MKKIQDALDKWEVYQADLRPETRNDFLRAYKEAHPEFISLALRTPINASYTPTKQ